LFKLIFIQGVTGLFNKFSYICNENSKVEKYKIIIDEFKEVFSVKIIIDEFKNNIEKE